MTWRESRPLPLATSNVINDLFHGQKQLCDYSNKPEKRAKIKYSVQ